MGKQLQRELEESYSKVRQDSLNHLIADFNQLRNLVHDEFLKSQIDNLVNELAIFVKISEKRKAYSPNEVDKLIELMDNFGTQLLNYKVELKNDLNKIGIYAVFSKQFKDAVSIEAHMKSTQEHQLSVKKHSPGHNYTATEKLFTACHRMRKTMLSFYNFAVKLFRKYSEGKHAAELNMQTPIVEPKQESQIFKKKKWS